MGFILSSLFSQDKNRQTERTEKNRRSLPLSERSGGLFPVVFQGLFGQIRHGAFRRNPAENDDVRHCVSAQAVAAVDAAADLAGREQAGNGRAFGIDDLSRRIDLHAAHGVMDTGSDLDGIIRCGGQVFLRQH